MIQKVAQAREIAASGVDYSARLGALCPYCGKKTKIYRTCHWEDTTRIRYHKCLTPECLISVLGISVKSVEEDQVVQQQPVGDMD